LCHTTQTRNAMYVKLHLLPCLAPWLSSSLGWAEANVMIGFFVFYCKWSVPRSVPDRTTWLKWRLMFRAPHAHTLRAFFLGSSADAAQLTDFWSQYTNTWHSQFLPCVSDCSPHLLDQLIVVFFPRRISSIRAYDNQGKRYNHTLIIDENGRFDRAAYEAYSPLYLSCVLHG
jgi:hypothetical protein